MTANTNRLTRLRRSRATRIAAIAMILVGSTSAVAQAKTGTTQVFRGVRFYFGETAGHGTLAPDVTLKKVSRNYNQGLYVSAGISTDSSTSYHAYVSWSAVPSAANSVSGFARDGFEALSPC